MGLALWDLLGTSEQHFFFLPETLSTSGRHTMLVSFNNGRFNFFWHVPICNLATRKGDADVVEGFLLAVVTQWVHSIFLMIFSFEKSCIFFEILFTSNIFVSSHAMSCQIVFLRLLFLRSISISNWWIVIAWLVTVSFSSANLNFKLSISSLFSRAYVLASWAVVLTAFSLIWISFVTLSSFSSNDVDW